MRNRGNILISPGVPAREKKVLAFHTISFLVNPPENEPGAGYSDNLSEDEGNHAQVPGLQGD